MSSLHETAYPRFKTELTEHELQDVYTPTRAEINFAKRQRKQCIPQLALLVFLKPTQRLAYVTKFADVPTPILNYIAEQIGVHRIQKKN